MWWLSGGLSSWYCRLHPFWYCRLCFIYCLFTIPVVVFVYFSLWLNFPLPLNGSVFSKGFFIVEFISTHSIFVSFDTFYDPPSHLLLFCTHGVLYSCLCIHGDLYSWSVCFLATRFIWGYSIYLGLFHHFLASAFYFHSGVVLFILWVDFYLLTGIVSPSCVHSVVVSYVIYLWPHFPLNVFGFYKMVYLLWNSCLFLLLSIHAPFLSF